MILIQFYNEIANEMFSGNCILVYNIFVNWYVMSYCFKLKKYNKH